MADKAGDAFVLVMQACAALPTVRTAVLETKEVQLLPKIRVLRDYKRWLTDGNSCFALLLVVLNVDSQISKAQEP